MPAVAAFAGQGPAAKQRLLPCVSAGNYHKVQTAPVTAIVAYELAFFDHLPRLYPHSEARSWFTANDTLARETAFRNSSLQGAYSSWRCARKASIAGRCRGFDADKVDDAFFPDGSWRTNFLLNIGYGERGALRPRLPRLGLDEVVKWA